VDINPAKHISLGVHQRNLFYTCSPLHESNAFGCVGNVLELKWESCQIRLLENSIKVIKLVLWSTVVLVPQRMMVFCFINRKNWSFSTGKEYFSGTVLFFPAHSTKNIKAKDLLILLTNKHVGVVLESMGKEKKSKE
jgi:hypothetical protein